MDTAILLQGVLWSLIGISTLILGALIAFRSLPSPKIVGYVMGFGAGALISAVAYELFPETSRDLPAFFFLGLGAIVFYAGTVLIERRSKAKGDEKRTQGEGAQAQMGRTILLGALLDGIPESLVLGMTLAIGGAVNIAFLGAIFVSNLPEAIAASSVMERGGILRREIYKMWRFVLDSVCH